MESECWVSLRYMDRTRPDIRRVRIDGLVGHIHNRRNRLHMANLAQPGLERLLSPRDCLAEISLAAGCRIDPGNCDDVEEVGTCWPKNQAECRMQNAWFEWILSLFSRCWTTWLGRVDHVSLGSTRSQASLRIPLSPAYHSFHLDTFLHHLTARSLQPLPDQASIDIAVTPVGPGWPKLGAIH